MTRQINQETRDKIEGFESKRLVAYKDIVGVWTIGIGHTKTAKPGMKITDAQAYALFAADLKEYEDAVERLVKVPLTDNQFGALVSFTYNVGIGALTKSTLLKKLNKGDYDSVPSELMKWNKAGGKTVKGLTNRRAAEAGLWAKGAFVSSQTVTAEPEKAKIPALQKVGSGIAGASGITSVAIEQLTPFAAYSDVIKQVLVILALVGVGFMIYSTIKKNKEASN